MATLLIRIGDGRPFVWTCPRCEWTKASPTEVRRRSEQAAHRFYCPGFPEASR